MPLLDFPHDSDEEREHRLGDAESCPDLLNCDDFIMCPPAKEATEVSAPDAESVDEELYASAPSPKLVGLEDWLEMPIVGPSPVMPSEDAGLEMMKSALRGGGASALRQSGREVSPGSTTSSVEVVSVSDLTELEKEAAEEDYKSIDTHGAWFVPPSLAMTTSPGELQILLVDFLQYENCLSCGS